MKEWSSRTFVQDDSRVERVSSCSNRSYYGGIILDFSGIAGMNDDDNDTTKKKKTNKKKKKTKNQILGLRTLASPDYQPPRKPPLFVTLPSPVIVP